MIVLSLCELNGFKILSSKYQDKIAQFFCQDRHRFIDINELIIPLGVPAKTYKEFDNIEEVCSYVAANHVISCLGYKTGHETVDNLDVILKNMSKIATLSCNNDIEKGVLTHVFPDSKYEGPEEEWYLVFE